MRFPRSRPRHRRASPVAWSGRSRRGRSASGAGHATAGLLDAAGVAAGATSAARCLASRAGPSSRRRSAASRRIDAASPSASMSSASSVAPPNSVARTGSLTSAGRPSAKASMAIIGWLSKPSEVITAACAPRRSAVTVAVDTRPCTVTPGGTAPRGRPPARSRCTASGPDSSATSPIASSITSSRFSGANRAAQTSRSAPLAGSSADAPRAVQLAQRDGLVRGGRQHEVGLAADGEGHAAEGAVEAARGELHPGIRQPGHRAVDGRDGGCEEPAPRRAAQEEGVDGVQRRDPPLAPEPQGGRREPVLGVREDEVGAGPVHQRAEVAAGGGVGADHRQAEEGHGQGGRDVVEGDARPVQLADGGRVGCRDGDRVARARERERLLDDGRLGPTEVGEGVVHHEEGSEGVHRG
ncbi:hypothetical protein CMMCAS08_11720 [Clavibacter michiganensis subsp. michiganensis]|nr:hypothetical protein CMMCAS08_11720 [Clavibacter michiganensis subsp. michiganensis]